MKKILLLALTALLASGCFSSRKNHNLNIAAAYPFEGRYESSDEIVINGNKAAVKDKDSIWILSSNTLYSLLTTVSDSTDKITFGNSRTYIFTKTNIVEAKSAMDDFGEEEYVWENWNISTNKIWR